MPLSKIQSNSILDASITAGDLAVGAARSNIGSGVTLQIIQQQFNTFEETTSTSFVDSLLIVNITTTLANSKILYNGSIGWNPSAARYLGYRLLRNGTEIYSPGRTSPKYDGGGDSDIPGAFIYLDSPSVSAGTVLTYKFQYRSTQGLGVARINDNLKTNIVLMEITG